MKMGKSTISTGPFSSSQTVNVYQAGYIIESYPIFNDDIPLIFPSYSIIESYPIISHYISIIFPLSHWDPIRSSIGAWLAAPRGASAPVR